MATTMQLAAVRIALEPSTNRHRPPGGAVATPDGSAPAPIASNCAFLRGPMSTREGGAFLRNSAQRSAYHERLANVCAGQGEAHGDQKPDS